MILGINQILCRIVFPVIGMDNRWGLPMYLLPLNYNSKMFLDIWQVQNPYIYNIFYIFIIGILAGGISLVFYGVSMLDIFKKMGLVQNAVFFFVFFIILVAIGQLFSVPMISFLSYIQVGQEVRMIDYGIFTGVLYLLGILFKHNPTIAKIIPIPKDMTIYKCFPRIFLNIIIFSNSPNSKKKPDSSFNL